MTSQGSSIGRNQLTLGAGVVCAIQAVYGLVELAVYSDLYPDLLPVTLAWILFILAFSMMTIALAVRGDNLPGWAFWAYLAALAGVVALDFVAVWPLGNMGYATASVTAGFGLLATVTVRPARELLVAASALFVAFVVAIVTTTPLTAALLPTQVVTVALAVLPPVLTILVVRRFRRMLQLELDRVLIQSTVSAPRFAVGMLASDELVRLDLAAERLLDSVAGGQTELPLDRATAKTAAALATELRLHLIEGRRETWLYHAVTESEQLGKSATLKDNGSLAGLLDPNQRDGLLSAVWLLVADIKPGPTAEIVIGPVRPTASDASQRTITIPIVITTTNISHTRVDPSIFAALGKVGSYTHMTEHSSLRLDIECVVGNPADQ
ncbi:MAG: hypothetical protein H7146_08785 [Burkholderiaceae bacterium]|nr:hypothetical protein [Microbacteriaceae bacterium]